MKTGGFIRDADSETNLFIVYYGGHGRINTERQAEWLCRRDPNSARVHWSAIQTLFAEAQSDVLILLDACAAASATTKSLRGSMEAIMACGFESKAPPPGEHSFTNTLINVLDEWIDRRTFSASCLHAEILSQLKLKENKKGREGKKFEWCVTPIHINCTQDPKAPSIELCRRNVLPRPISSTSESEESHSADAMDLDFDDPLSSPLSSLSSRAPSGEYHTPHVIISVALEDNQPNLDVKETARWLASIPFLAKWAKVEGVFKSYSTLLLLSVPVPVWNMLPDHPACSFVGFATSPNLVTNLSTHIEIEAGEPVSRPSHYGITPTSSTIPPTAFSNVRISNDAPVLAHNPPINSSLPSQKPNKLPSTSDIPRIKSISHDAGPRDPSQNQYSSTSPATQLGAGAGAQTQPPTNESPSPSPSGTIEIFKSVYVNMEDPCHKILLAALKKHNINASWEQYALYIIWGQGMEQYIEAEEKPLIIFQQLKKEGKDPTFMLRKRDPIGVVAQPVWGVLYARILMAV